MKVAELRTFVVGNPPPSFGGRYFVFLTLTTDDGVKGLTFIAQAPDQTVQVWIVSDGTNSATSKGTATPALYDSVDEQFEDMAKSVVLVRS